MYVLSDYFESIVKPTVQEYLDDPNGRESRRRCVIALLVLAHTADYYAIASGIKKEEVDNLMQNKTEMYSVVKWACNASKHRILTNKHREITNSEQINTTKGLFEAPFGEGGFEGYAHQDYIEMDNGKIYALTDVLMETLQAWDEMLFEMRGKIVSDYTPQTTEG